MNTSVRIRDIETGFTERKLYSLVLSLVRFNFTATEF